MEYKVIAAVKDDLFDLALSAGGEWIFDLSPDIASVKEKAELCHRAGKRYFIHFDLAAGIGKDRSGILFAKEAGVDGIISTRVNIIKIAKELQLFTIQRFFIVDSHSVDTTIEGIKSAKPDMIEIMPGIVPKVIKRLSHTSSTPIIAGGLIETEEEISLAHRAGAVAVSSGKKELW